MTTESLLTIGAVSERTGLPAHTLRFYEQEDLLVEPVRRDASGRRRYSESDVRWLRICETLRSTDMPLADIRRYVAAARRGPQTVDERGAGSDPARARAASPRRGGAPAGGAVRDLAEGVDLRSPRRERHR